ncbi:MAG: tetratricopeptide (TPR) repeat protein [Lentisphaeria bacterium]|jgi:tetratricopeptide (TPR) repeat protein
MAAVTSRDCLRTLVLLILVSVCSPSLAAKEKKLVHAQDLRYGVALYYYYQGDYMQALTELLVAKERGGIQGHGDNPEIMEGGFSLGYGLERRATAIFEKVLRENRSKASQDAAWFFLSKLRYLRKDWQGAEEALAKVRDKPALEIRDDVYGQRITLAIKQNKLDDAKRMIRKRKPSAEWMPYIYFNMGASYARQQDYTQAVEFFDKLADDELPTDELRALYDKSMTSSGYAYLLSGRHEEAIAQFSRVRLTSNLSNRALLGYGWAAVELGRFEEALKPWKFLAESSLIDENSQEAQIAVPYAYEKLGSDGFALKSFQKAEANFVEEMERLDNVIDSMRGNQLIDALKIERSEGLDWLKHVRDNQVTPQLGYLAELFSREEFQGVVQELRDLIGIQDDLSEWQTKLVFYAALVVEREQGRTKKAEDLAARELAHNIKLMKAKRADLAKKIETIAATKDYLALASADDKVLIDRVLRAKKNIEALRDSDPFIDESEEAVRRYFGILYWEASEIFSDRLWRAVKTLHGLDITLSTVSRNHNKVQFIIDNAQDLAPMKQRIANAQDRVEIQLAKNQLAIDITSDDLRQQTNAVLLNQRVRLNHYLAQSRLSIARLYDKALQAKLNEALAAPPVIPASATDKQPTAPEASGESEPSTANEGVQ